MKRQIKGLFLCTFLTVSGCAKAEEKTDDSFAVPACQQGQYAIVENGIPDFTDHQINTKTTIDISPADSLKRPTRIYAVLGPETLPDADASQPEVTIVPTGFTDQMNETFDILPDGRLWTTADLLPWTISGKTPTRATVIPATESFYYSGLQPFTDRVETYIREQQGHVLWQIQPVYDGDDQIPMGVILEIFSVEDQGDTLSEYVYICNSQAMFAVDYSTGETSMTVPDAEPETFLADLDSRILYPGWCIDLEAYQNLPVVSTYRTYVNEWGYTISEACM